MEREVVLNLITPSGKNKIWRNTLKDQKFSLPRNFYR